MAALLLHAWLCPEAKMSYVNILSFTCHCFLHLIGMLGTHYEHYKDGYFWYTLRLISKFSTGTSEDKFTLEY